MSKQDQFKFEISLSVLNHLGRNLYRNFITVLGEAISNSWDADAKNIWITIDRDNQTLVIIDDGEGMTESDFQDRFLKVGYSKRKEGTRTTKSKRPYIGAKGIGKLALLSCAERISIYTRTNEASDYTGGVIDNSGLDEAITDDVKANDYILESPDHSLIEDLVENHKHGTIIYFEQIKPGLRNKDEYLRKLLAMQFKFSLIDENFNIHLNDRLISIEDLNELSSNTEFCWIIGDFSDEYVKSLHNLKADSIQIKIDSHTYKGFIASVTIPSNLRIRGADEFATIDVFVNGRIREKDILRHIPINKIVGNYIYGQIHVDDMDNPDKGDPLKDPFTSSREGIKEDDDDFKSLLQYMNDVILPDIVNQWDKLRLERGQDGDAENNTNATKKERSIKSLYAEAKKEFSLDQTFESKDMVDQWLNELGPDAEFNISAYTDCYLSENLIRQYIVHKQIVLPDKQYQEG